MVLASCATQSTPTPRRRRRRPACGLATGRSVMKYGQACPCLEPSDALPHRHLFAAVVLTPCCCLQQRWWQHAGEQEEPGQTRHWCRQVAPPAAAGVARGTRGTPTAAEPDPQPHADLHCRPAGIWVGVAKGAESLDSIRSHTCGIAARLSSPMPTTSTKTAFYGSSFTGCDDTVHSSVGPPICCPLLRLAPLLQ